MRHALFFAGCAIALCSCGGNETKAAKSNEPSAADLLRAKDTKATELLKAELKDPDSARFRNVRRVPFMGMPSDAVSKVYCGEVNAKNAMGGYAGFGDFAVNFADQPDQRHVIIVESGDRASEIWYKLLCFKDGKPIPGKEVTLGS